MQYHRITIAFRTEFLIIRLWVIFYYGIVNDSKTPVIFDSHLDFAFNWEIFIQQEKLLINFINSPFPKWVSSRKYLEVKRMKLPVLELLSKNSVKLRKCWIRNRHFWKKKSNRKFSLRNRMLLKTKEVGIKLSCEIWCQSCSKTNCQF